jgi:hypothetical protein
MYAMLDERLREIAQSLSAVAINPAPDETELLAVRKLGGKFKYAYFRGRTTTVSIALFLGGAQRVVGLREEATACVENLADALRITDAIVLRLWKYRPNRLGLSEPPASFFNISKESAERVIEHSSGLQEWLGTLEDYLHSKEIVTEHHAPRKHARKAPLAGEILKSLKDLNDAVARQTELLVSLVQQVNELNERARIKGEQ